MSVSSRITFTIGFVADFAFNPDFDSVFVGDPVFIPWFAFLIIFILFSMLDVAFVVDFRTNR